MAVVIKTRICRQCGANFEGGPRAWYCPACRAERRREANALFRNKGRKANRPLGSVDKCVRCGAEYVVNSALQKYCPACAHDGGREADRPASRRWNQEHKETYYPDRNKKRRKARSCVICGAPITAKTATITCDNPACKLERKRQRQRATDAKRRGIQPPAGYVPTKKSKSHASNCKK